MFGQFLILYLTVTAAYGQLKGESCAVEGRQGTCTDFWSCPSALDGFADGKESQTCVTAGGDPLVCCVDSGATPQNQDKKPCAPVSAELTSPKTGQKAWDKCIEYQERFIYPCEKSLTGEMTQSNYCFQAPFIQSRIVEGTDAAKGEFPHMVLLGYGDDPASVKWLCGGTLLSERFILTAGHCSFTRDYGSLTYAAIGILKRSEVDSSKVYKIKRIVNHPEYQLFRGYNDISLLETETQMQLSPQAFPACLDVGKEPDYQKAIATGWGAVENYGETAENLQKVTLTKFREEECLEKYGPDGHLDNGFNTTTQICYGDYSSSKDTCEGDSGGPLQVKNTHVNCMYTIVGVTSFARACGFAGQPGVYTKVEPYVPWIESVVWA